MQSKHSNISNVDLKFRDDFRLFKRNSQELFLEQFYALFRLTNACDLF